MLNVFVLEKCLQVLLVEVRSHQNIVFVARGLQNTMILVRGTQQINVF